MIRRTRIILLAGATALVIAVVGTGIAFARGTHAPSLAPSAASSTASAPHGMRHGHGRRGGLLARIEHGEATVKTGHGYQVVDFQRGTVESVNSGQLSVRSADGFSASYGVDKSTKVHTDRRSSDISQVHANDRVTVVATKAGGTATATRIRDTGPAR